MPTTLFGSISTIADTSELQRKAFNDAFASHGLDWNWGADQYRTMLATSGGKDRIAEYANSVGQSVDARAVHEAKSTLFRRSLSGASITPRTGVLESIKAARDAGAKVGLVTTTSRENITALLDALSPHLHEKDFDLIVDVSDVDSPKPDRAAYAFALQALGEEAGTCVAIEDNVDGVGAATAAGIRCVAFPNENTAGHDFSHAAAVVDHLDPAELARTAEKS